jgi:hypothetical protein
LRWNPGEEWCFKWVDAKYASAGRDDRVIRIDDLALCALYFLLGFSLTEVRKISNLLLSVNWAGITSFSSYK